MLKDREVRHAAVHGVTKLKNHWRVSLVAQRQRIYLLMQETRVLSLGQEDPMEQQMVTHSSILTWEIP